MVLRAHVRTLVWILLIVVAVQVFFISFQAISILSPDFNARAAGSFSLCLNHPPEISFDCDTNMRQDYPYSCNLSYSDADNDSLSFFYDNTTGYFEANFSDNGVFYTTPTQEMVGNRTVLIGVRDSSGCPNSESVENVTFQVGNVNDPPEYVRQIKDMEWSVSETLRGIFLDDHFDDPDGDPLEYDYDLSSSNFDVTLLDSSEVVFTASSCGDGFIIFTAEDPFNESVDSHIISLNVPCETPSEPSSETSSSSSSSFSKCTPEWRCDDWSRCYPNGTQKRECIDIKGCEDDYERMFWRVCEYIEQCENGVRDPNEDGVDCGGPCPPCETCDDGILNNEEEEVDCGGPNCPACKNCSDGIQNYGETGVDCGGPCPPCETCDDGIQNQNETGIDCGGPCPPCPDTETPHSIKAESGLLAKLLPPLLLGAFILVIFYRFFKNHVDAFVARILWFLTRDSKKQILLLQSQKLFLLSEISRLEKDASKDLDTYQSRISILFRKFYFFLIGQAFEHDDAVSKIFSLHTNKEAKRILENGYSITLSIENSERFSLDSLDFFTELLRELIIAFSEVSKDEIARVLDEKEPVDKPTLDNIVAYLHNAMLALQFLEVDLAKEKYISAHELYGSLPLSEQELAYPFIRITFELISYTLSFSGKHS